jgi:hypothetical protein
MKRFEVWVDCDDKDEKETRRRVEDALDKAGVEYTMLATSLEIVKKGSQK